MDQVDLEDAHRELERLMNEVLDVTKLLDGASPDVFLALSYAVGALAKVQALIGRSSAQPTAGGGFTTP